VPTQPDNALPPWGKRLLRELDASDARAMALVKPLTPDQLNWKPAPDKWSVGQCLEHLAITNEVYLTPIADALEGPPSGAVDEITPGWFASWFIRNYIAPSAQTKRGRAPGKIAPVLSRVEPSILERFLKGNRGMRELVTRAGGYDVNRLRFANPFIPLIRFTVGAGFEITSKHQDRHLLQAERVAALIR
jgi:hypothetical protein